MSQIGKRNMQIHKSVRLRSCSARSKESQCQE